MLSREAWAQSNRNCVFWLEFENNVKLLVEMQDKQQPHLEEIPLFEQLPQSEDKIKHGGDTVTSPQIESVIEASKSS